MQNISHVRTTSELHDVNLNYTQSAVADSIYPIDQCAYNVVEEKCIVVRTYIYREMHYGTYSMMCYRSVPVLTQPSSLFVYLLCHF